MEYLPSLHDPHYHVSQPLISVLSEKAHFVTFYTKIIHRNYLIVYEHIFKV